MPATEATETSPDTMDLTRLPDPLDAYRRWLPEPVLLVIGLVVVLLIIGLVVVDVLGLWPQ